MDRPLQRAAFTMIELLVLLGMLVMAAAAGAVVLEKSREGSNRAACMNNLKSLGLAAHHYHDTYKSLPPGWWGSKPSVGKLEEGKAYGPGNGPFPQLLPFLNSQKLFDRLGKSIDWDPKQASMKSWLEKKDGTGYNLAAFQVACTPLKFLQCPADSNTPLSELSLDDLNGKIKKGSMYVIGGSTYTFSKGGTAGDPKTAAAENPLDVRWGVSGPGEWSGYLLTNEYDSTTAAYNPMARVNYFPVAGLGRGESPFYNQFEGVFTNRSANTFATIRAADGMANTLMFGEASGQLTPAYGEHSWQNNLFAAVGTATHRGLQQRCAPGILYEGGPVLSDCDNMSYTTGDGQKARYGVFSSCHPEGVLFCFCDGSVRMMARGKTWLKGSTRLVFVPAACRLPRWLPPGHARFAAVAHTGRLMKQRGQNENKHSTRSLLLVENPAMDKSSRRSAFTMIELLLLLGMIAMAAAVSAVAVEKSRESSSRAACMNNLKLLGVAAHHYHDTYKSLPPGWWGTIPNVVPFGQAIAQGPANGPFPQLLPFMNSQKLFDRLGKSILWDPQQATTERWSEKRDGPGYNIAAFEVACTPLKAFQCPADINTPLAEVSQDQGNGQVIKVTNYMVGSATCSFMKGGRAGDPKTSTAVDALAVNWGQSGRGEWSGFFLTSTYDSTTAPYNPMARVNYLPVAGLGRGDSPFYNQFEGVFTNRSANTFAAISAADGTANTLMFGETCGQFYPAFGDYSLQNNLFGAVGTPTHRGLQQRCAPGVNIQDPLVPPGCDDLNFTTGEGHKARFGAFSSVHPAGVLFCFCDGSVRTMARGHTWIQGSPDWYLFQQLAGFHDGFHRDTHSLLP